MSQRQRRPAQGAPASTSSAPAQEASAAVSNELARQGLTPASAQGDGWWQEVAAETSQDAHKSPLSEFFSGESHSSGDEERLGPSPALEGDLAVGDVVTGVEEGLREEEELAPPEGIHRPEVVTEGQWGALLTKDATIDLKSGPGADASVAFSIPNGTPCQVVAVDAGYIQVELRAGGRASKGWVASGVFSDQPQLFMDENNSDLQEDYTWTHTGKDETTDELAGSDVEQGYLSDCYFISAMNAVGTANPEFLEESIVYNEATGMYKVRLYKATGYDFKTYSRKYEENWVEVDGYLPTKGDSTDGAYATASGGKSQWGAIIEKAYAVQEGGYNVMGGGGSASRALEALTGKPTDYRTTDQLAAEDVIPFFERAKAEGYAMVAGSRMSVAIAEQTPLTGDGGHYRGTIKQDHEWNHMVPGTVKIEDLSGQVGLASDTGVEGDKTGRFEGADVAGGTVDYHGNTLSVDYADGKAPASAQDLQVSGQFQGMLDGAKQVIACHGYSFDKIVDGKLIQLYNPWGSRQPKPLTPEEFLNYFASISTNQVPEEQGVAS